MEFIEKEFTDSTGVSWVIGAKVKSTGGRKDIVSLTITPLGAPILLWAPISRRLLCEISLEKLFSDELSVCADDDARILRSRKGAKSHRGRAHREEELGAVADVYMAAYRARKPVQRAVADAFGVSISTASKQIMIARSRGIIPVISRRRLS